MIDRDSRGYYAALGIQPGATEAEIKAAFRRKAQELHPDKNKAPGATEQFQRVNEAYRVLGDPEARAQYDIATIETSDRATAKTHAERAEPIVCHCCGKVTAQPRYCIFYDVKSFIFQTSRTARQGIFCSTCAGKNAIKASAITWLLGWWGFPWGPVYSIQALVTNLFGGKRPSNINAKLAAHQAWVFACMGNIGLAQAVANDALELAKKIEPDEAATRLRRALGYDITDEGAELKKHIMGLIDALGGDNGTTRLKNTWPAFGVPFNIQSAIAAVVIGFFSWVVNQPTGYQAPPRGPKPYVAEQTFQKPDIPVKAAPPEYVRPSTAPNGHPWPKLAGYIKGFAQVHKNGLSKVTIDNGQNDSDVFVKLVSLSSTQAFPVRTFYIPAHGAFTLDSITPGSYDIRYRDLDNGRLSRSQRFDLDETKTYDGTEFSNVTMTLYKVRNGNMQTYGLSEDEF